MHRWSLALAVLVAVAGLARWPRAPVVVGPSPAPARGGGDAVAGSSAGKAVEPRGGGAPGYPARTGEVPEVAAARLPWAGDGPGGNEGAGAPGLASGEAGRGRPGGRGTAHRHRVPPYDLERRGIPRPAGREARVAVAPDAGAGDPTASREAAAGESGAGGVPGAGGAEAVARLDRALSLGDPATVLSSIDELETLGGREAAEAIGEVLHHPELGPDVLRRAIEALGWVGHPVGAYALRSVLFDEDPAMALAAVVALEDIGGSEGAEALGAAFERGDPHPGIEERALEALAWIGGSRASEVAGQVLERGDPAVRQAAVEALYEIGDAEAVRALEDAARTAADPEFREALADLCEVLGGEACRAGSGQP